MDIDLKWYVLLTEPNRERIAAARLKGMGFKPYLPTFLKMTKYTVTTLISQVQKQRPVERPLFPGYLFVPMPVVYSGSVPGFTNVTWNEQQFGTKTYCGRTFGQAFAELYRVPGLRTGERQNCSPFFKINGRFVNLTEAEMAIIREVTDNINNPNKPLSYKIGDKVRILDGSFAERLAEVATLDDDERIMLLLDLFGQKTKTFVNSRQITAA